MRGADTLIPARFLTLVAHLSVLVVLLWESQQKVNICLKHDHPDYFQVYHSRLVGGFSVAVALAVLELATFMLGASTFSHTVSVICIATHGLAAILLTYLTLDGCLCEWFWPIFALCSVFPSIIDVFTSVMSLCCINKKMAYKKIFLKMIPSNEHQQLTQSTNYQGAWSFYLVLAGVATTLGSSVPVGYSIGVVNTPAEVIKNFCNESIASRYDVLLTERGLNVLWSSIVSIFIVGGCTGSVLGAVLADNLGRKKATIVTSVLSVIGAALFLCCRAANSVEMLILGRLIVGLSAGLTTSIVPMYLTELAPLRLTGAMGVACPMGVNVGVLVGQVMGLQVLLGGVDDWPYLLSVYALLVIICLPVLFILPESPKYLFIVKKNEDVAIKELSRVRGVSPSILTEDLELLREESRAAAAAVRGPAGWGMWRVLHEPRLRLPLLLACSMQAGQQTSGINAVFYYSQTIFKRAGLSDASAQYATIGCGAINVATAVLMLYLLPRFGRRPLLLGSVLSAAAILAALAASMSFLSVAGMSYVCMVAVLAYVLVYGLGLGPIPYFIASELFEVGPRPAGMAWGSLANWGGNFLVGMCFPLMRDSMGAFSFLLFAAVTAALYLFQKVYFPETRGKTPTQIAQLCSRGLRSRPNRAPSSDLQGV